MAHGTRMDFPDIFLHFFNFVAPALVMAVMLPGIGRLLMGRNHALPRWWLQVVLNALVGMLTLGLCFWFFGRDGKMAAYGALVLAMSCSQWLLMKAWRR